MSSSTSAWLLSPLECPPQKQNGWMLCFCFWGWILWKMYNKTIIEFVFRMISWIIKPSCLCYLPQPLASADNTDLGFDNSWYHAQPHPIIVYYCMLTDFPFWLWLLLWYGNSVSMRDWIFHSFAEIKQTTNPLWPIVCQAQRNQIHGLFERNVLEQRRLKSFLNALHSGNWYLMQPGASIKTDMSNGQQS